ncbi:Polycomb protein suz12 [Frankliniella fusca]|uniref:Polycomb protein suz12 n=1 Tax=Frankliniella fusca TaxID=407009 RepID=A0AAE1HWF0_9NEOP|nr:Polycomb protein suz12 [Frankliniella fusca]
MSKPGAKQIHAFHVHEYQSKLRPTASILCSRAKGVLCRQENRVFASTMPPKKREKEGETSKNQRSEAAKTDHDLFLQAFEKPTQIYRYLRVRNANSPIFLQRNLSYMQYRMSRSHRSRQSYEVNSLLEKVSKSLVPPALRGGFMTLTFLGFYDKKPATGDVPKEPVKVETLLLKICHKKRKDSITPIMTVTVGTSIVPTNPSEDCPPPKAPTVSISVEEFCEDQSEVKSYHLLLRVYNAPNNGLNGSGGSDQDSGEPLPKRRRTSSSRDEIKLFGTDLVIYDKQKQCLLGDGDYELLMDEIIHPRNSSRKIPSWEQIGDISENILGSLKNVYLILWVIVLLVGTYEVCDGVLRRFIDQLAPLQRLREFAVTEFMYLATEN